MLTTIFLLTHFIITICILVAFLVSDLKRGDKLDEINTRIDELRCKLQNVNNNPNHL
jgi:hypothetical protein